MQSAPPTWMTQPQGYLEKRLNHTLGRYLVMKHWKIGTFPKHTSGATRFLTIVGLPPEEHPLLRFTLVHSHSARRRLFNVLAQVHELRPEQQLQGVQLPHDI